MILLVVDADKLVMLGLLVAVPWFGAGVPVSADTGEEQIVRFNFVIWDIQGLSNATIFVNSEQSQLFRLQIMAGQPNGHKLSPKRWFVRPEVSVKARQFTN